MLEQAGMGDTYLELKEDGTGKLKLFDSELDITWKNGIVSIGYDWIEYVGKVADGKAISIGTVDVDLSDGSVGSDILDSISFK
ncbi:MAG: hypothetical protein K6E84_04000 [Lachnospiraceae bacterium]|nr:hypothetical protein [Lachnospiraceae bacterium]